MEPLGLVLLGFFVGVANTLLVQQALWDVFRGAK